MAADLRMSVSMVNNTKSVFNALNTSFKNLANMTKKLAVEMDKMNKSAAATQLSKMQKELDGLAKTTGKAAKEFTKQADATSKAAAAQGKFASEIKGVSALYNDYYQKLGKTELAHKRATKEATKWENAVMGTSAQLVATGNKVGTFTKNFDALGAQAALTSKDIKKVGDVLVPVTAAGERALGMNKKQAESLRKLNNVQTDYKKVLDKNAKISYVYRDAVQSLGKQFGYGSKEVAIWSKALDQTATATKNSRIALKAQTNNVDAATKAYRKHVASIDPVVASQKILSGDISVVNGKFKALTSEGLRTLGVSSEEAGRRLGVLAAGFKRTQEESGRFGRAIQFVGNKLKSFIAYTISAAATAAALGTAMRAMTANIEFSQALKDLEAITRATTEEMGRLDAKIREIAGSTKFSAKEIAEGMKLLGQAGFSASETIQAMESVANLATGTLSTMNTSVEVTTTALRVFGIDASKTSEVVDVFTNTVNNSKMTVDKIKTALNYLGPIASRAGISLQDTSASMMVLANSGMRASSIATSLRRVFKELVSPTDKMKKAIREAGLSVEDFDLRANDMQTVIKNLQYVVTDVDKAFELFGLRGATAASALATQGVDAFNSMSEAVNRQGTAAENASIQLEGMGILYKQIKDKAHNLALAMGDAGLNGVLRAFANVVRGSLDAMTAIVGHPITAWVVKLTAAFAALVAVHFASSMQGWSTALVGLTAGLKKAAIATKALTVAMLKNPYVLAVAGVVALVAVLVKLHKSNKELIREYNQIRQDSQKMVTTMDQEIASLKNFNKTAEEKVKYVNALAEKYPEFAAEIYDTRGEAEQLEDVFKRIQQTKLDEFVDATRGKLGILKTEFAETYNNVLRYQNALNRAKKGTSDYDEAQKKLSQSTQEYNEKLGKIAVHINQIREAGGEFSLEEWINPAVSNADKFRTLVQDILQKQKDMTNEVKETAEATKRLVAEKIEEAKKQKESALAAQKSAEIELQTARDRLASLKEVGASESEIYKATRDVQEAQDGVALAVHHTEVKTKALLELTKSLVAEQIKEVEIQKQIAEIHGDDRALALAEENAQYLERINNLETILIKLEEEGKKETKLYQQVQASKTEAYLQHQKNVKDIKQEYSDREIEIEKRKTEALSALDFDRVDSVDKAKEEILQSKQEQYRRELASLQEKLRQEIALNRENTNVQESLITEIEDKKKKLYATEKKLLQQRTKDIEDSYEREIELIDGAAEREIASLKTRYELGRISKEDFEQAKINIEIDSQAQRLSAARTHLLDVLALENATKDQIIAAREQVRSAESAAEQARAQALIAHRQRQLAAHQARMAQIEEEKQKEKEKEEAKKAYLSALANYLSNLYGSVARMTNEVGAKATRMISDGNIYMESIANNAADATSEFDKWNNKLQTAVKNSQIFRDAHIMSMSIFKGVYGEVSKMWSDAAQAIQEKIRFMRDVKILNETEIDDMTDIEAVQQRLNMLKEDYVYLGEKDLDTLRQAKLEMQEKINQQRILNQEKENERRLEQEQQNTAAIDAATEKLERLRAEGADIEAYGFDEESAQRLDEIKEESAEIKAQIAEQRLQDAQHLQALQESGKLTEERRQLEQEAAQERLQGLLDAQEMLSLEAEALTSRLDIEKNHLLELNELKITQAEEEEERARLAHEKALQRIKEQNDFKIQELERVNDALLQKYEKTINTLDSMDHSSFAKYMDDVVYSKTEPQKMARGGQLPGESTIDSIPVLARPGEWFIRNESARAWTQNFGSGFMKGINEPLSAAGQAIKSALKGASVVPAPASAPVPKTNFLTGGQVVRYDKDDGALTKVLSRIEKALSDTKRNDEGTRRSVSVNIQSGGQKVVGNFTEEDAKNLMAMLQKQQGFAG